MIMVYDYNVGPPWKKLVTFYCRRRNAICLKTSQWLFRTY